MSRIFNLNRVISIIGIDFDNVICFNRSLKFGIGNKRTRENQKKSAGIEKEGEVNRDELMIKLESENTK